MACCPARVPAGNHSRNFYCVESRMTVRKHSQANGGPWLVSSCSKIPELRLGEDESGVSLCKQTNHENFPFLSIHGWPTVRTGFADHFKLHLDLRFLVAPSWENVHFVVVNFPQDLSRADSTTAPPLHQHCPIHLMPQLGKLIGVGTIDSTRPLVIKTQTFNF